MMQRPRPVEGGLPPNTTSYGVHSGTRSGVSHIGFFLAEFGFCRQRKNRCKDWNLDAFVGNARCASGKLSLVAMIFTLQDKPRECADRRQVPTMARTVGS